MDNSVWLPYTTAGARIFGQRFFNNIVVRVKPGADMSVVQAELHTLLIKRHRQGRLQHPEHGRYHRHGQ